MGGFEPSHTMSSNQLSENLKVLGGDFSYIEQYVLYIELCNMKTDGNLVKHGKMGHKIMEVIKRNRWEQKHGPQQKNYI